MSNLKHYINGIISGDEFYSIEKKLRLVVNCLAVYHVFLAIAFYFTETFSLMFYNIASSLFFFVIVKNVVKKQHFSTASVLCIFEVSFCAIFSTLCTGAETGFASYNIGLITACFYMTYFIKSLQKKEFVPFLMSVLIVASYFLNYIVTLFFEPFYLIQSVAWTRVLYIANHLISFGGMIAFSFLLVWEVRLSNDKLSSKNAELDIMAHKDPLTKLYNRRSMNKYLDESLENLKLRGRRFSLILGDIDDFKKVNDTYGHEAGDVVLATISEIIESCVKDTDYVCRWGGEEILILINEPLESAILAGDKMRRKIESTTIKHNNTEIKVTMTFGISESIPGYRIEHLIQQADAKLYEGKQAGKNTVIV